MSKVLIYPALFEIIPLDIKGKKVLIKPNVLRGSDPKEGIVTNPAVVRAVVEKVEELFPSSIMVGDNPGLFNYGANEESFKKTGLFAASRGYYINLGTDLQQVNFNSEFLSKLSIPRAVLEADIMIRIPKFKTHALTVITGAIKNNYGILPGAQKAHLHKIAGTPERFHEILVHVFNLRVPDLFIMDAIVGIEGNGPASSDLREIGLIIASDNGVSMDVIMAKMIGLDPKRLLFLRKAAEFGLGSLDLDDIEIVGELKKLHDFKLPPFSPLGDATNGPARERLHRQISVLPKADPMLCISCGTCIIQCPVSALWMEKNIPTVKKELCIKCFCCQEICPEKAIILQ